MLRSLFIVTALLASISLVKAQEGMEAFQKGYKAHRNQSYEKALRYYSQAIERNDTLKQAFFNRASVRISMGDFQEAKKDLDRTIELDPDYVPAYYNRANIYTEEGNYKKAHKELNRVLRMENEHRKALMLRGQVRQHIGKEKAGCRDLKQAQREGARKAGQYLEKFCDQKDPLDLESRWPDRENWTVVQKDDEEQRKRIQLVPKDDSFPEWEHLGVLTAIKKVRGIPMDTARYFLKRQAEGKCKDAEVRTLEKRDDGLDSYIFFTMSCSDHINTQQPETQLWYVEQGRRHLYAYFVAVRKTSMSQEEQEKWMRFFSQ